MLRSRIQTSSSILLLTFLAALSGIASAAPQGTRVTVKVTGTVEYSDPALRILGITGDRVSGFTIEWSCEAGAGYQVQYSERLRPAARHCEAD